jgi:hypothetical protein
MAMSYCPMKKGYTFSLVGKSSCCCEKTDHGNCCKSKKIVLKKIEDRYVASTTQVISVHFETIAYEYSSSLIPAFYSIQDNSNPNWDHAPPGRSVSLNILHGSLLI